MLSKTKEVSDYLRAKNKMDALALMIGIGMSAFLILFFATYLEKKHFLFRILCYFIFLGLLLLIPKAAVDYSDHCNVVVANTTVTGNTTAYEYQYFCDSNTKNTPSIFYEVIIWFIRLFATYVIVYLIYESVLFLSSSLKRKYRP